MDDISEIAHLNKLLEEERQKRINESELVGAGLKVIMGNIDKASGEMAKITKRVLFLEAENRRLLTENAELRERS